MVLFIALLNLLIFSIINLKGIYSSKLNEVKPLNVLIHLGLGTRSHIKGILEISEKLSTRGHSITYATFDDHLRFSKGYNVTNQSLGPALFEKDYIRKNDLMKKKEGKELKDFSGMQELFINPMNNYYNATYPVLDALVKENSYDLMVCDYCAPACIDIAEKQGIPLIVGVQTTDNPSIMDIPYVTKSMDYGSLTFDSLDFYQRFYEAIIYPIQGLQYVWPLISSMNKKRESIGLSPSNSVFGYLGYGLVMSNSFVGFEMAVPMTPNIVHVGPIITSYRPGFNDELDFFYQNHDKVVYVAFGSFVLLSQEQLHRFTKAILIELENKVIDGVIWGLGNTSPEDFPSMIQINNDTIDTSLLLNNTYPNIKLLEWAPQETILHSDKTKLFVSHCGLESAFEAITSQTPVLCIPFLGDQPRNAKKLEVIGIGQFVDKDIATSEDIASTIEYLVTDKNNTIQPNLKRINVISQYSSRRVNLAADLMEQHVYTAQACRPTQHYDPKLGEPPCELKHLINVGSNIPFIKRNLLDVYFFALSLVLSVIVLSLYITYKTITLVYQRFQIKVAPKSKNM